MGHMLGLSAHLRGQEILAAAWRSKVGALSGTAGSGLGWAQQAAAALFQACRPAASQDA